MISIQAVFRPINKSERTAFGRCYKLACVTILFVLAPLQHVFASPNIILTKDELSLSTTMSLSLFAGGEQKLSERYKGPLLSNNDPEAGLKREIGIDETAGQFDWDTDQQGIRTRATVRLSGLGLTAKAWENCCVTLDFNTIDGYVIKKTSDAAVHWNFHVNGGDVELDGYIYTNTIGGGLGKYVTPAYFLLYDETLNQTVKSVFVLEEGIFEISFDALLLDGHRYAMYVTLRVVDKQIGDFDDEPIVSVQFKDAIIQVP